MSLKFGYASIDEHGHAKGGKKGDQTGRELRITDPYDFGQCYRWRFRNRAKAQRAQKIMKWIINSNLVGYNQSERGTLFALAKSCDWNFAKFKKLLKSRKANCDCSSLIATVINLTFKKSLVPCFATGQMWDIYVSLNLNKYFKLTFVTTDKLKGWIGDIMYKQNKHVIMCLK